jgi:hypothetical protein
VGISEWLDNRRVVSGYEVHDYRTWPDGFYVYLVAQIADGTQLHVREYVSSSERMYSYHWQRSSGVLICRWDNAPHHRELATFPHHKHVGSHVQGSTEIGLDDVLELIAGRIAQR